MTMAALMLPIDAEFSSRIFLLSLKLGFREEEDNRVNAVNITVIKRLFSSGKHKQCKSSCELLSSIATEL